MLLFRNPGHHEAGEVGHGEDRDVHAHDSDVLGQDLERLHPGPVVPSLGRPVPFHRTAVRGQSLETNQSHVFDT